MLRVLSILLAGTHLMSAGTEIRVLVVGDSWAEFMWNNRTLRNVFVAHGVTDVVEQGAVTAISGSTAVEWATPSYLQLITDELTAYPTVDTVLLSMGGNDFLAGQPGGGWYVGMPPSELDLLLNTTIDAIQTVIDHILNLRPSAEIILNLYDYTNFVESLTGPLFILCNGTWQDLGQPTPIQINQAQIDMEQFLVGALVDGISVFHVSHYGAMQFHFGYPSMSILPGTLPPPGDLMLPSPPQAMFLGYDCFHLNPEGYQVMGENLWQAYFEARYTCVSVNSLFTNWPVTTMTELVDTLNLCP
ncbi:MAG: SGNH/GDSL hydrolase family protein [Acidobacteria bacterium]|nr:SGNH/GDSL hydrolase family protein [Acidobacteriota bacterium]